MTQEHPITPPPELMQQWANAWHTGTCTQELLEYIATQAARWGADQELEACVEWLADDHTPVLGQRLRARRRPKPPSLKQQALEALEQVDGWAVTSVSQLAIHENLVAGVDTIRRALEALPDD